MMPVALYYLITVPLIIGSFFLSSGHQAPTVLSRPPLIESKGIYLTGYTAGSIARRSELEALVNQTELNSMVIDLKDYSGRIFVNAKILLASQIGSVDVRIPHLEEWIAELKNEHIYTIARIVVFQDPYLAQKFPSIALKNKSGGIWRDRKGLSWVDPTQQLVWDYNIDLARYAAKIGFDEVNFDYIRFPSDGDINQIVYANLDKNDDKSAVMAKFYEYVDNQLVFYPIRTSADLFGMTLWRDDGLNIGQRYQDAAAHFDYISPMVYPSHYPPNFQGFANPADHPYEIVYQSLIRIKKSVTGNFRAILRPWLQDFNLGAIYTADMVLAEKRASIDANSKGWLLWNAANRYTESALASHH